MKAFRPTPAGPREENAREPHPEVKMPVSNCKQTRAVTHSCELQERICFRTVTILNFFRKLFVQLIQYSYLCHSKTESIRHNGETRPARGCTVAENEQIGHRIIINQLLNILSSGNSNYSFRINLIFLLLR